MRERVARRAYFLVPKGDLGQGLETLLFTGMKKRSELGVKGGFA